MIIEKLVSLPLKYIWTWPKSIIHLCVCNVTLVILKTGHNYAGRRVYVVAVKLDIYWSATTQNSPYRETKTNNTMAYYEVHGPKNPMNTMKEEHGPNSRRECEIIIEHLWHACDKKFPWIQFRRWLIRPFWLYDTCVHCVIIYDLLK